MSYSTYEIILWRQPSIESLECDLLTRSRLSGFSYAYSAYEIPPPYGPIWASVFIRFEQPKTPEQAGRLGFGDPLHPGITFDRWYSQMAQGTNQGVPPTVYSSFDFTV